MELWPQGRARRSAPVFAVLSERLPAPLLAAHVASTPRATPAGRSARRWSMTCSLSAIGSLMRSDRFLSIGRERDLLGLLVAGSTGGACRDVEVSGRWGEPTQPRERTSRCELRVLSGLRLSDSSGPATRAPLPSNERPECAVISLQKGGVEIHLPVPGS